MSPKSRPKSRLQSKTVLAKLDLTMDKMQNATAALDPSGAANSIPQNPWLVLRKRGEKR